MDFWMLRMPKGCRLSNLKRRKVAKIHAFGRIRITLATLRVWQIKFHLQLKTKIHKSTPLRFTKP